MGVHQAIAGWFTDSAGPFQNQESISLLIMHCFKINIQNQEKHFTIQYQESISILRRLNVKIKKKIDSLKLKINIQNQIFQKIL